MQGESREDLSPCDPMRGVFSPGRRCSDSALEAWYADVFPGFIEKCRDRIVENAGPENIVGLILSGSFASCEGSMVMLDGHPVFLSDMDLVLVVSSAASHAEIYHRRSIIGKECEELLPDVRFDGRIDIGVITPGELAGMPQSPGVFDIREKGVLLYGEKGLFGRFPSFNHSEIGADEALRLIENRMAAFLGYWPATDKPEGKDLSRFLYGVSRVYTDILTASLCAADSYQPGYAARAGFLADSTDASELRGELGRSLTDDVVRWTRFKIDPVVERFWTGEDRAPYIWLEAAGVLLAVRERVSRNDHGRDPWRVQRLRELFRAWKAAVPDIPFTKRVILIIASLISGRGPEGRVREESLRLIRHAVGKGTGVGVGSAPGGYPHRGRSWEEAASMTSAEWRRLVTGREEESLG